MTLEGAINLNETADYIIYTMNSAAIGQYGIVMPKTIQGTLNMLIDLHMKASFDEVSSGSKTKEQLIVKIGEEYSKVKSKYSDGVLVMPMIDGSLFQNVVATGDKQKMFDLVKKIGAITSELYKKLMESGVEKQKIDQKIIIVEKNQDDENFVLWLKEQMPNFVDGFRYSELSEGKEVINPFMSDNSLFGPAVDVSKNEVIAPNVPSVNGGGIFDNATSSVPVDSVISVEPATKVNLDPSVQNQSSSISRGNIDIFGIPTNVQDANQSESIVVPDNNTTTQSTTMSNNVGANSISSIETPKPVESSPLEGTTTFRTIASSNVPEGAIKEEEFSKEGGVSKHTSNGFVNLLILIVVLIGVTIASIELGKFLYSVYGA